MGGSVHALAVAAGPTFARRGRGCARVRCRHALAVGPPAPPPRGGGRPRHVRFGKAPPGGGRRPKTPFGFLRARAVSGISIWLRRKANRQCSMATVIGGMLDAADRLRCPAPNIGGTVGHHDAWLACPVAAGRIDRALQGTVGRGRPVPTSGAASEWSVAWACPPAWWSRLAADHLLDAVADLGVDVARVLEGKRRPHDASQLSSSRGVSSAGLVTGSRRTGHQTGNVDQARSKRSRFMTLSHAATKSRTNFSFESSHA
jgi:hypothetical protein